MPDPLEHPWSAIRSTLRMAVSETTWTLWLADLELERRDGDTLVISAPPANHAWIAERFDRLLQRSARTAIGPSASVRLLPAGSSDGGPVAVEPQAPPAPEVAPGMEANPRYTFDQFVIGDSNRLAHAACLSVAELPGLAYNPLYICGPPGLGKTHLLHSIANYLEDYGDNLRVRAVTAEAFTNDFLGALQSHDVERFKAAYRDVDVLLVDDVQFLERKTKTEEQFFHTFNALHAAGSQIVLTSDRPPHDLAALEDRLRERFEAGLVADVQPPDLQTRLTILRKRTAQDGLDHVDPEALEAIAQRLDHNIRLLEGALIRIVAYASLTGRDVSAELAHEVLDGLYPGSKPRPRTVAEIQERTAAAFGLAVDDLVSGSRTAAVAWARHVAMYLTRELTDQTLPAIGRAFGGRNHSTVLSACRRAETRIAEDPEAYAIVQRLTEELQSS